MSRVFLSPGPTGEQLAHRYDDEDLDRAYAAVADGDIVATYRSFATTTAVPGGRTVPTCAVSNVTVTPTHRRRRLLTRMIEQDLAQSVDRGEVLSLLVAAEWPIYGRFGFGSAVERAEYELETRGVEFLDGGGGDVRLVDAAAALPELEALHEQVRRSCPGSIQRARSRFEVKLSIGPGAEDPPRTVATVADTDGTLLGYAAWHAQSAWDGLTPRSTVVVDELLAATPDAQARLWRFLVELDLVTKVTADMRPLVEPLAFRLTDGRRLRQVRREDLLWARILDVPGALEGRAYPTSGSVVVEVVDPYGHAAGRWALDVDSGGATCRRTTASADLTMPVQTLSAAYLGGTRVRTLADAGLLDAHTPGAVDRADVLLGPVEQPWALTFF